jgi:hypothetical protein
MMVDGQEQHPTSAQNLNDSPKYMALSKLWDFRQMGLEWRLGSFRKETRVIRWLGLERLGCFHGLFGLYPNAHVHLTLGTRQEKKFGPDKDEQEDVDGAWEIPRRDGKKHNPRRNVFVIV